MKATLGLSMIIKNERDFLEKHFRCIYDLFDDIVIVDTGSNDGGIELLKNDFGIDVHIGKLDKNCSLIDARNKSLELNNADLILVLDADEIISRESIERIKGLDLDDNIKGYFLKFIDYRYGEPFEDYKLSLLRNGILFQGYVHANPQQFLRTKGYKAEYLNNVELQHYPKFSFDKTQTYIEQMLYDLEETGGSIRIYWFIGYSYYKLGNNTKAIAYLNKAININDNSFPVEKLNAYVVISYIYYMHEENFEKSLKLITDGKHFLLQNTDDFEVKINFRLKAKIYEMEKKIKIEKNLRIYEYTF